MTKRLFPIITFLSFTTFVSAQKYQNNPKITQVEKGLFANTEIVFADSIVPKFNIYERMKFYNVPSVSIAVVNKGRIEWARAYGFADISEQRKADIKTLYQAASISKSINALYIMKLVQDGELSLDKDIRQYLKTWTFPDNEFSNGKVITLKNLMSHTAGLSTSGFIGYSRGDTIPTINEILDGKRPANSEAVKPVLPPNTQFRYSGGGTMVIRKIIDDNVALNYDSTLQKVILQPLGMRNSTFTQPLRPAWKNVATAYNGRMQEIKGKYHIYPEQAPDGLWTSATDLAKFVISIQKSLNNKPSLLKQETVKEMLSPVLTSSNSALGVFIEEKGGEKYFTHNGANVGYRSSYYGSVTTGSGVIILTNSDNGRPLINEIINSVATAYNWKGFYHPAIKKLVHVSETLLDKYIGEYVSENPQLKIMIIKKDGELELTARQPERMYATSNNTFFLLSSPAQDAVFLSSNNNDLIDTLEVREGTKVLIKAIKKQ
ncbi:MAG: beta-lactamase family protein [Flavisolibacter sp.]|nr:beta-lactamase family protein [Flavisolibacter sp.]